MLFESTMRLLSVISVGFLLGACAGTQSPAPVESRTPVSVATPVAKPGYYIVKPGDTLYSIALEHGQYHRDLVAWNSLTNPNLILVGQELRVVAPGGVASAAQEKPVSASAPVAVLPVPAPSAATALPPLSGAPSASATVAGDGAITQEPRGGRQPYSEEAWKALQSAETKPVAASTPAAEAPKPVVVAPVAPAPVAVAPSDSGGENVWAWPVPGRVLAGFNESTNKGVNLAGTAGEPVLAAASGKVLYVGNALRGFGNLVIIRHSGNYQSVYAHNSEILVKESQSVTKGQKIATVGSSDADRPMLHFEIRREGKPVDPMKYLPSR